MNPQAALAWFEKNLDAIRQIPVRPGTTAGMRENGLRLALSHGFILADSQQALAIVRQVPSYSLQYFLSQYSSSCQPSLRKDASGYIQVSRGLLPEEESINAIICLFSSGWGLTDTTQLLARTEDLLNRNDFTEAEAEVSGIVNALGAERFKQGSIKSIAKVSEEIVHFKTWLENKTSMKADRQVGESLALFIIKHSVKKDMIAKILTERETSGLTHEAAAGFLGALEKHAALHLSIETINQISAAAADSEEVQAIAARIHERYHR